MGSPSYYRNYVDLSRLDHWSTSSWRALRARPVPRPRCLHRLQPAAIQLAGARRAPPAEPASPLLDNYNRCTTANEWAKRLVRANKDLSARGFRTVDVAVLTEELTENNVVFLAALVSMAAKDKARVVAHLGRHMAPGATLVVQSAHGAHGFLRGTWSVCQCRGLKRREVSAAGDLNHHDQVPARACTAIEYPAFEGEMLSFDDNNACHATGTGFPAGSEFVGMVEYAASIHDLLEDPSSRDSSSKAENPEGVGESRECLMVDTTEGGTNAAPTGVARSGDQPLP
ncbi:putative nicotianamine synthase 3 [Dichanthelium oligosanthes]|uniref:Nicotianamine synthase n=1 Tax=Dichanthelium oligosanthes TaxID=888268 RepID=A0A1E5V6B2_9POAL|nr:putative nicotianamine synthase 3 [Dichanthelium oligosanthes]